MLTAALLGDGATLSHLAFYHNLEARFLASCLVSITSSLLRKTKIIFQSPLSPQRVQSNLSKSFQNGRWLQKNDCVIFCASNTNGIPLSKRLNTTLCSWILDDLPQLISVLLPFLSSHMNICNCSALYQALSPWDPSIGHFPLSGPLLLLLSWPITSVSFNFTSNYTPSLTLLSTTSGWVPFPRVSFETWSYLSQHLLIFL